MSIFGCGWSLFWCVGVRRDVAFWVVRMRFGAQVGVCAVFFL